MKRVLKRLLSERQRKALLLWRDRGDRYLCPLCEGRFRQFWPSGIDDRPNTLCPQCSSLERHRLLWLYLKNRTDFFTADLQLLHFAPEAILRDRFKAQPNITYLSTDLDSDLADVHMDITDLQFEDNRFDVILCVHVLEHIPDDAQAMKELYRVLKPGGWAIVQSPMDVHRATTFEDPSITSPEERERVFNQRDHVRLYGRDYEDRLEAAGFSVKIDGYVRELGEQAQTYGLNPEEDVYFCTKAP